MCSEGIRIIIVTVICISSQQLYQSMATALVSYYDYRRLTDTTNTYEQKPLLQVESLDKAKRCLFGVPDHRTTSADLSLLRRQLDTHSRQRWNFDFRTGTPVTSLPLSTATSDSVRWLWTRQDSNSQQSVDHRRSSLNASKVSSSPGRLLDRSKSTVKRQRMSLTPSVEVRAKVTRSEMKAVSCRKSVGGIERRRLLRSTSLLGSPSSMLFTNSFFHGLI